jgi:hypothetical protein
MKKHAYNLPSLFMATKKKKSQPVQVTAEDGEGEFTC